MRGTYEATTTTTNRLKIIQKYCEKNYIIIACSLNFFTNSLVEAPMVPTPTFETPFYLNDS